MLPIAFWLVKMLGLVASYHARHQLAALRFWNRFINLPSFKITTRVFLWDLSQCDKVNSWSCNIRNIYTNLDILETFDSIEYWDLQTSYRKLKFSKAEKWNDRRKRKPNLRYHIMFKADLEIEYYLFFKVLKCTGVWLFNSVLGFYLSISKLCVW